MEARKFALIWILFFSILPVAIFIAYDVPVVRGAAAPDIKIGHVIEVELSPAIGFNREPIGVLNVTSKNQPNFPFVDESDFPIRQCSVKVERKGYGKTLGQLRAPIILTERTSLYLLNQPACLPFLHMLDHKQLQKERDFFSGYIANVFDFNENNGFCLSEHFNVAYADISPTAYDQRPLHRFGLSLHHVPLFSVDKNLGNNSKGNNQIEQVAREESHTLRQVGPKPSNQQQTSESPRSCDKNASQVTRWAVTLTAFGLLSIVIGIALFCHYFSLYLDSSRNTKDLTKGAQKQFPN